MNLKRRAAVGRGHNDGIWTTTVDKVTVSGE